MIKFYCVTICETSQGNQKSNPSFNRVDTKHFNSNELLKKAKDYGKHIRIRDNFIPSWSLGNCCF